MLLELHKQNLIDCIELEMQEQETRYQLQIENGLKQLKAMGVALHPITVARKSFGYADYPEISFKLPFLSDTSLFKENSAIECFLEGEEPVKGSLLRVEGQRGEFRLFAPDFPDWIEEKGVGIKLSPDHYTSEIMKKAVYELSENERMNSLFNHLHGTEKFKQNLELKDLIYKNNSLNSSQQKAASAMVENDSIVILHGPPGTGKTTTLIEGINQLVARGKRVIATAASNAAVDNIALGLLKDVTILRVGNTLKVDDLIFNYTPDGKLQGSREMKEIKKLKIRSEEMRKLSYQYKRNFGKAEREQRKELIKEVKRLRKEIKSLRVYFEEKLYENADVILGTPIGLKNFLPATAMFDVLVMDEAGQAVEPLAWVVFPYAKSHVLAGDPFQLPPTVLSEKATSLGYTISILEQGFKNCENIYFLDTQYRMKASIAGFSNEWFYKGKLITPPSLKDTDTHLVFYDTAGTGFEEEKGKDGVSLINSGEIDLAEKIISENKLDSTKLAFISPYSGQVQLAKESLSKKIRISTIDSFQGQEKEVVILSLVRSNPDAVIGFLKDYRRMNVAMTRAKNKLYIVGDSSTIGQDAFYEKFLEYMDKVGGYKSAWELMG